MPAASGVKVPYWNTTRKSTRSTKTRASKASQVVGVAMRIRTGGRAPTMNRIRMRKIRRGSSAVTMPFTRHMPWNSSAQVQTTPISRNVSGRLTCPDSSSWWPQ